MRTGGYEVTFLSSMEDKLGHRLSLGESGRPIEGVRNVHFRYRSGLKHKGALSIQRFADETFQGKAVYDACKRLQSEGYRPDIIVCHGRWGAGLFVKDAYPDVPLLLYSEFFSTAANAKACLAPGQSLPADSEVFYRLANACNLISLDAADHVVTPTAFQKQSHPAAHHAKISVIFDGVDAERLVPQEVREISVSGRTITADEEIVTYVTRNFEPYRGFETFMRSAEILLRERPKARVLIGGGCENKSYGGGEAGEPYRKRVLSELSLDRSRVQFLGPLTYAQYVHLLRFSQVHVYLTVPFVLSWSLIEAMSLGCAIVGSRTAPVEEVMEHGKNGLLADLLAPQDVAEQVAKLLGNPKLRSRLGQAARKTVLDRYATDKIAPQYVRLFARMVKKAGARA
jgi:glycosyltransferase involved in cell wall biosynthesis